MKILRMAEDHYNRLRPKVVEIVEGFAHQIEGVITVILAAIWLCRFFSLLTSDSALKPAIFVACFILAATNVVYLGLSFWELFLKDASSNPDKQLGTIKLWNDVERLAFLNGRCGITILMLSEFLTIPLVQTIAIISIPYLYFVPFSSVLHLIRFLVVGRRKLDDQETHNQADEPTKLAQKCGAKGELKSPQIAADLACMEENARKDDPSKESFEEVQQKEDQAQHDDESKESFEEVQQKEAQGQHDDEALIKEIEKSVEESDVKNGSEDEGMPELEEITKTEEGEGKTDATMKGTINGRHGKNYYRKKLKKVEEKREMEKSKHREERKAWTEKEKDLRAKFLREYALGEYYRGKARENGEKARKLEEQKDEMIRKLCTANVLSDLYRNLLHDANSAAALQHCCHCYYQAEGINDLDDSGSVSAPSTNEEDLA